MEVYDWFVERIFISCGIWNQGGSRPYLCTVLSFRFNIHCWSNGRCHREWQDSRSHWPKRGNLALQHF